MSALKDMLVRFVKDKHCGRAELARFGAFYFQTGSAEINPDYDASVEAMVEDLVKLRTKRLLAEKNKEAKDDLPDGCLFSGEGERDRKSNTSDGVPESVSTKTHPACGRGRQEDQR